VLAERLRVVVARLKKEICVRRPEARRASMTHPRYVAGMKMNLNAVYSLNRIEGSLPNSSSRQAILEIRNVKMPTF
jgi:hypothetical protein